MAGQGGFVVEIKAEKVDRAKNFVRFAVYADGKIWLKVSFVKDADNRVHALFNCREFYDERGLRPSDRQGKRCLIPPKTYAELKRTAAAILKHSNGLAG